MTPKTRKFLRLSRLYPEEISLVDEGANGKRILITKRRRPPMPKQPKPPVAKKLTADQKVEKALNAQTPAVRRKIEKKLGAYVARRIRKDAGDDEEAEGAPLSDAAQAAMKAAARILQPYGDEITQGDLDYVGEVIGASDAGDPALDAAAPAAPIDMELDDKKDEAVDSKEIDKAEDDEETEDREDKNPVDMAAEDDPPPPPPDDDASGDEDDDPGPMDDDEAQNDDGDDDGDPEEDTPVNIALPQDAPEGVDDEHHEAAAQAARDAYVSTLEATGYKVAKSRVTKRAPRTQDMNLKAALARIEKRAAKAEADLAVERNARLEREYTSRAEREFGALGETERVAKSLREVREKMGQKAADEFETLLRGANARIQKAAEYGGNILSEVGHSQPGTVSDSGEARIRSMTEELVQKAAGDAPGKAQPSRAQIARQVLKSVEGRTEYKKYRAAR